jgi:hypothetical protein
MKSFKLIAAAIAAFILAAALVGAPPVGRALADFDWSPLIVQFEARVPNIGGSGYPPKAIPVQSGSVDEAATAAVATLPGAAGLTTYITHFRCTGTGATAAVGADITVAGPTNSLIYIMGVVAGATLADVPVDIVYSPPQPAAAVNTAVTVTMASLGTGNLHAACAAEGFQTAAAP